MHNQLKWLLLATITATLFTACGTPECIQCNEVQGYPTATICRDTYETTMGENTPSWKEYANDALEAGCTKAD